MKQSKAFGSDLAKAMPRMEVLGGSGLGCRVPRLGRGTFPQEQDISWVLFRPGWGLSCLEAYVPCRQRSPRGGSSLCLLREEAM